MLSLTVVDGGKSGDISVDNNRHGFRSQYIHHSYSRNRVETVDDDWRGGYRSHTSHFSSHKPRYHDRLRHLSVASCHVHESIHDNERGDSRGGNERREISP